jgi:CheY-like chemotaxis protein
MAKETILVVDDEEDILELVQAQPHAGKATSVIAETTGEGALKRCRSDDARTCWCST